MIATVIDGEADLADSLFLIAVILFAVVAIMRVIRRDVEGALVAFAATALSLGWLVL